MPKMLSINIGFVTNSSSVVYHFPRELFDNADIQKFIRAYELEGGIVGSELWSRDTCSTIAVTKEQKQEVAKKLAESEYGSPPAIDTESDDVVVIYGDEYDSIASTLAHMLSRLAGTKNIAVGSQEYN